MIGLPRTKAGKNTSDFWAERRTVFVNKSTPLFRRKRQKLYASIAKIYYFSIILARSDTVFLEI
jgi:hypothetical protein